MHTVIFVKTYIQLKCMVMLFQSYTHRLHKKDTHVSTYHMRFNIKYTLLCVYVMYILQKNMELMINLVNHICFCNQHYVTNTAVKSAPWAMAIKVINL